MNFTKHFRTVDKEGTDHGLYGSRENEKKEL